MSTGTSETPIVFAGIDRWECPDEDTMESLFDWTNLWWTGFYLGPGYNFMDKYGMLRQIGWGVLPTYFGRQPAGYSAGILKDLKKRNPKRAATFDLTRSKAHHELTGSKTEAFDLGVANGDQAGQWASSAGIPRNSYVYLDCELPSQDPKWIEYLAGWIRGLVTRKYLPGCYCSYFNSFPQWIRNELRNRPGTVNPREKIAPEIWAFRVASRGEQAAAPFSEQHPSGASSVATVWQYAHNANLTWNDGSDPQRPEKKALHTVDLNTSLYRDPSIGAASNRAFLTKEAIRGSRLKKSLRDSGQFKPGFQQPGQLKPPFNQSGQLKPPFDQSGQLKPGFAKSGQFINR